MAIQSSKILICSFLSSGELVKW